MLGTEFKIQLSNLLWLSLGFFFSVIAGTLAHETGHYVVAKLYGYKAAVHYASCSYQINNADVVQQNGYDKETSRVDDFELWFILGGIIETLLTGTIGLIFLFIFKTKYKSIDKPSVSHWILIFLTLFCLREPVNLFMLLINYIFTGTLSINGDEAKIALHFGLPSAMVLIVLSIISLIIFVIILFKFIPYKQRLTFLISGLVGGAGGYYFWLIKFGPIILP